MNILKSFKNLNRFELILWLFSVAAVIASSAFTGFENPLSGAASLIGVTALIFVAKGDVSGQVLTVIFSVFYGIISYGFRYYGEMITYLCMTAPMAVMAVISWLRHPYGKNEVRVNRLKLKEFCLLGIAAAVVTIAFYFILKAFDTENLFFSTLSVTTSFVASYLTFRRSAYYALAYAMNDIVLIILWIMAAAVDMKYLPMILCFVMFFANDMYGFINWKRMQKKQAKGF